MHSMQTVSRCKLQQKNMCFETDICLLVMGVLEYLFSVMFGNLEELDNRSFRISASSAVYYNLDIERGIHIDQLNEYIHTLEANPDKYQAQFDVSTQW